MSGEYAHLAADAALVRVLTESYVAAYASGAATASFNLAGATDEARRLADGVFCELRDLVIADPAIWATFERAVIGHLTGEAFDVIQIGVVSP